MLSKIKHIQHLSLLAFALSTMNAQEVNVLVPANSAPSRDAHFNWKFQSSGGGQAQVGQFACGSYWVAPAPGDTGVTLVSLTGNPTWNDFVSCDADPVPESHGLLDGSNNYGSYNSAENIIPNLPMTFSPPSWSCNSLVAAMQRNEAETSNGGTSAIVGEVVDAYSVVTVLPVAPSNNGNDMIRPNITGAIKEFLTWDDFDLSRIPSYSFIPGRTLSSWQSSQIKWRACTEIFGGLNVETTPGTWKYFSEGGRAFRSHLLINNYGAGMAREFNDDLLSLFSSANSLEEKKGALAAMLSFGLDIYHARYDYGIGARKAWLSGAGQQLGKYIPTVFLASLLKDEAKAHVLRKIAITNHGSDYAEIGPQELRQITRGVTGVILWGDGTPFIRNGNNLIEEDRRYWSNSYSGACYDTALGNCNPAAGKKTIADPYGYIDGPAESPGTSYMPISSASIRTLAAAMILMPDLRSIVNTDAPIEYTDRILSHGLWTAPDPVAPISVVDQTNTDCSPWTGGTGCTEYGITWGPDLSDIRFAIEDGTGRFTSKHGQSASLSSSYDSSIARNHWATIFALYDGETYLDNAVPLGTLVAPEIFFETGASPKAHLLSPNPGAEIRYTLDGNDPTEGSALYTAPIPVINGTTIRTKAFMTGMTSSSVRENVFDFSVPPPDDEIPTAPTNLIANNPTGTTIDLSWNPSSDNIGVAGYKVFANGAYIFSVTAPNIQVSGLSSNTSYTFTVSAYDATGNESPLSAGAQAKTIIQTGPVTPIVITTHASAEQSGNEAVNATDGDIATRWAAAGDPQSIEWELDQEYHFTAISLSFNNGNARNYYFDLEISADGTTWTNVFSGQSSGTSNDEDFDIIDSIGRYVRFTGHGNSANTWNGLTEVSFTASIPVSQRTWAGYPIIDDYAEIAPFGWLKFTDGNWVWSYLLTHWLYAPDPGPDSNGFWLYIRK